MEFRQSAHQKDAKYYTTDRLREEFLIDKLFVKGEIKRVYSHIDRIIAIGVCPGKRRLFPWIEGIGYLPGAGHRIFPASGGSSGSSI